MEYSLPSWISLKGTVVEFNLLKIDDNHLQGKIIDWLQTNSVLSGAQIYNNSYGVPYKFIFLTVSRALEFANTVNDLCLRHHKFHTDLLIFFDSQQKQDWFQSTLPSMTFTPELVKEYPPLGVMRADWTFYRGFRDEYSTIRICLANGNSKDLYYEILRKINARIVATIGLHVFPCYEDEKEAVQINDVIFPTTTSRDSEYQFIRDSESLMTQIAQKIKTERFKFHMMKINSHYTHKENFFGLNPYEFYERVRSDDRSYLFLEGITDKMLLSNETCPQVITNISLVLMEMAKCYMATKVFSANYVMKKIDEGFKRGLLNDGSKKVIFTYEDCIEVRGTTMSISANLRNKDLSEKVMVLFSGANASPPFTQVTVAPSKFRMFRDSVMELFPYQGLIDAVSLKYEDCIEDTHGDLLVVTMLPEKFIGHDELKEKVKERFPESMSVDFGMNQDSYDKWFAFCEELKKVFV